MTDERLQRQLEIEKAANDYSYNRLMKQVDKRIKSGNADELLEGRLILLHSIDAVAAKIEEYFKADLRGEKSAARTLIAADFEDAPRELAFILIVTLVRNISQNVMVPVTTLAAQINRNIYDSILVRRLDKSSSTLSAYIDKRYKHRGDQFRSKEKLKIAQRQKDLGSMELKRNTTYIGATLIDLVIKSGANIIETKLVRDNKATTKTFVLFTEECYRMVIQSREQLLQDYQKYPILVTKPAPWTSFMGTGGYYNTELYRLPLIKTRATSKKLMKDFFNRTDQTELFNGLNNLQETAWRINKRVFGVMSKIFDNNIEDVTAPKNNPKLVGGLPYNGYIEPEDFINPHDFGEIHTDGPHKGTLKDKTARRNYHKALEDQRDICLASNGRALMFNLTLMNAREYLNEPEIYFSYQYDFRGRIYPIQQHLQPQGSGDMKALLEFKNGNPIDTEEALRWFKINGANYYGFDKLPYDERVANIDAMTDDIVAIAENPFATRDIWGGVEEPFLWLAWCFEYSDYLKDRDGFLSHLPVALDATCSGIQIYSGLLRDKEGAKAVNVIGDTREDIYQQVADRVNGYLVRGEYQKEFSYVDSTGKEYTVNSVATAESLKGKVTRSLVKRNVMTQPYSVTARGMVDQLIGSLNELENNNKKFWVGDTWFVAYFLALLNDRAIGEVVKGARIGQEYLKEVTRAVVKDGDWVFYVVPITGFPVLQKIHKTEIERINTPIGKLSIRVSSEGIDSIKMQNGIAPNFVHSLDASLLATTVAKLKENGCNDFHMIHDSYGVPVNHVVALNKAVREAYIELFDKNPLKLFVDQVRPSHEITPDQVMINTLDLSEVADSKYIFS